MKKGISLIVLVITIIVMIILAASVVITLSNTGVINRASEAVDATNQSQVQDLAALIWADAFMDNKRDEALVTEVTTKLGEQGITAEKWNIEVSNTGVTVTSKNNVTTLGSLIKGPEDYGKTVDYTVTVDGTTHTDWQIYYEDEANGNIFLITKDGVATTEYSIPCLEPTEEIKNLHKIFKLGQDGYELGNHTYSSQCVAWIISNFSSYANTSESYRDYVVGAMGGPTIELLAAGYNAKHNTTAIVPIVDTSYNNYDEWYEGTAGYFVNQKGRVGVSNLINDDIYIKAGYYYWLTSPSACLNEGGDPTVMYAGYGLVQGETYALGNQIRPVVCIKSNVPATVGTTTDFSLVK